MRIFALILAALLANTAAASQIVFPGDGGGLTLSCADGESVEYLAGVPVCGTDATGGGAGVLDLGDNGVDESTAIAEIAITGDSLGIFSEPSADKLLINAAIAWPQSNVLTPTTTDHNVRYDSAYKCWYTDIGGEGTLTTPNGVKDTPTSLTPLSATDRAVIMAETCLDQHVTEFNGFEHYRRRCNPTDFTTGSTTSGIQECVTALCDIGGGLIELGPSNYVMSSGVPITVACANITISGVGPSSNISCTTAGGCTAPAVFEVDPPANYFVMQGVSLSGDRGATRVDTFRVGHPPVAACIDGNYPHTCCTGAGAGTCSSSTPVGNWTLDNVKLDGDSDDETAKDFDSNGILVLGAIQGTVNKVHTRWFESGITIDGVGAATTTVFVRDTIFRQGTYGASAVLAGGGSPFVFHNVTTESLTRYGVYLKGQNGSAFVPGTHVQSGGHCEFTDTCVYFEGVAAGTALDGHVLSTGDLYANGEADTGGANPGCSANGAPWYCCSANDTGAECDANSTGGAFVADANADVNLTMIEPALFEGSTVDCINHAGTGEINLISPSSFPGQECVPTVSANVRLNQSSTTSQYQTDATNCTDNTGNQYSVCYELDAKVLYVCEGSPKCSGSGWVAYTGAGDIGSVFTCLSGDCTDLVADTAQTFDMTAGGASKPVPMTTTLPGTCSEGQQYHDQNAGGPDVHVCTASNTWHALVGVPSATTSTDNAIARFDSTTGRLLQNSGVTVSDTGVMDFPSTGAINIPANATAGQSMLIREDSDLGTDTWAIDLAAVNLSAPFSISPQTSGRLLGTSLLHFAASDRVQCRDTAAAGAAEECTASAVIDMISGASTQGSVLYRGAAGWSALAPGTANHVLHTQGAGADPIWAADDGAGGGSNVTVDGGSTIAGPDLRSEGEIDPIECTGAAAPDASCAADDDILFRLTAGAATSAELRAWASDETGTGAAVFSSPTALTLDVEAGSNAITIVDKLILKAAACRTATASLNWDDDPGMTEPAAGCFTTGTQNTMGVADFDAAADEGMQITFPIPSDWDGNNIGLVLTWAGGTGSTNNVDWNVQTACTADAQDYDDTAFNAAQSIVDAGKGTANQRNTTASTNLTTTGCAAGEDMTLRVFRDADDGANDTYAADARLISAELTIRRAQ